MSEVNPSIADVTDESTSSRRYNNACKLGPNSFDNNVQCRMLQSSSEDSKRTYNEVTSNVHGAFIQRRKDYERNKEFDLIGTTKCSPSDAPFTSSGSTREYSAPSFAIDTHSTSKVPNHETPRYNCKICDKELGSKASVRKHRNRHTKAQNFKCQICGKEFFKNIGLSRHMVIHTGVRAFECEICHKTFKWKSCLKVHKSLHVTTNDFQCYICGESFRTKPRLYNHKMSHNTPKKVECEICGKVSKSGPSLYKHVLRHTTSFKCQICAIEFSQRCNLKRHMLTHYGVKNYQCGSCSKAYRRMNSLRRHELEKHSDIREFQCEICSKAFAVRYKLTKHMRTEHGQRVKCEVCGKACKPGTYFRQHLATHLEIPNSAD